MWIQYFGFQEEPFGVSPDPRCLYLSHTHQEALAALERGFSSNRGFTAMIAPPGMGKTTLLFRFLEDIRESTRTVFLFDIAADCEPRELVAYVLRDLGITPAQSSFEMHQQLSDALVAETQAGRKFVIVIDEAQSLSDAVLERVRLLTNFETSRGKMMHIVLSGQPQLDDKLVQTSLLQLRQRISTVCRIEPLSVDEIASYIDYRVKLAGYEGGPLFTGDALKLIAEAGQGTPRTINNLCYNALSLCFELKRKQVDGSMATKVIANLQLIPQSRKPIAVASNVAAEKPRERNQWKQTRRLLTLWGPASAGEAMLWVPAAVLLMVMCVPGAFRLDKLLVPQLLKSGNTPSLTLKAGPAPVPAPAAANTVNTIAMAPIRNTTPLEPGNAVIHHASAPASAAAVQPTASIHEPLLVHRSIPKPSAAVHLAAPVHEPLLVSGSISRPSAAAQAAVMPQESAAAQSPSTSADANTVTPQQSPARAGQRDSLAAKVRPALTDNSPVAAQTRATLNVRPALPERYR
ncbi:MAG TPA: AAA family ATPase [Terracidiphilus sp.]|nr:AAA family ATPase [Terracidiphilus sp.]